LYRDLAVHEIRSDDLFFSFRSAAALETKVTELQTGTKNAHCDDGWLRVFKQTLAAADGTRYTVGRDNQQMIHGPGRATQLPSKEWVTDQFFGNTDLEDDNEVKVRTIAADGSVIKESIYSLSDIRKGTDTPGARVPVEDVTSPLSWWGDGDDALCFYPTGSTDPSTCADFTITLSGTVNSPCKCMDSGTTTNSMWGRSSWSPVEWTFFDEFHMASHYSRVNGLEHAVGTGIEFLMKPKITAGDNHYGLTNDVHVADIVCAAPYATAIWNSPLYPGCSTSESVFSGTFSEVSNTCSSHSFPSLFTANWHTDSCADGDSSTVELSSGFHITGWIPRKVSHEMSIQYELQGSTDGITFYPVCTPVSFEMRWKSNSADDCAYAECDPWPATCGGVPATCAEHSRIVPDYGSDYKYDCSSNQDRLTKFVRVFKHGSTSGPWMSPIQLIGSPKRDCPALDN
jgi:hypothetical protein